MVRGAKHPAESKHPLPPCVKDEHVREFSQRSRGVVETPWGSFDCVNASLREPFTSLWMTGIRDCDEGSRILCLHRLQCARLILATSGIGLFIPARPSLGILALVGRR